VHPGEEPVIDGSYSPEKKSGFIIKKISEMNIRTLIIDDEKPARDLIKHYLKQFPEIEICGEYEDGFSGAKAINDLKPDLIFLDIQMPRLTGLELLELLEDPPLIIFSTAYDQYALRAFELNASDYLLKPYSGERFNQAIAKVLAKLGEKQAVKTPVSSVLSAMEENPELLQRIAVKNRHKIDVIPVDEILYIEAADDYVMIHTADKNVLKEKTMKFMETHLDPNQFVRIHRSYIVNVNFISRLELYEKESYAVVLKNGKTLKASLTGYKALKQMLKL
jgi:two-component system, LytTR family, response regulator